MKRKKLRIENKFIHLNIILVSVVFSLFSSFILTIRSVHAQESKVKLFCKLSRPEKCWVLFHPFITNRAWKITQHSRQVTSEVKVDSLLDNIDDGGQLDAFRHTYWMASLSQKISWRKAIRLGEAHEKGNYLSFKKGIKEEGSIPDSSASAMDRFNNILGMTLSKEHRVISPDSLKTMVIAAILEGRATIIARNKAGRYVDCDRNVLNMDDYGGQWNIPKCLVPSNTSAK